MFSDVVWLCEWCGPVDKEVDESTKRHWYRTDVWSSWQHQRKAQWRLLNRRLRLQLRRPDWPTFWSRPPFLYFDRRRSTASWNRGFSTWDPSSCWWLWLDWNVMSRVDEVPDEGQHLCPQRPTLQTLLWTRLPANCLFRFATVSYGFIWHDEIANADEWFTLIALLAVSKHSNEHADIHAGVEEQEWQPFRHPKNGRLEQDGNPACLCPDCERMPFPIDSLFLTCCEYRKQFGPCPM